MRIVRLLDPVAVISPVTGKPQQRRIAILERDDGCFTFAEEYYDVSKHEGEIIAEGWTRHSTEGIFPDADTAEREGRSAYPHLSR